MWGKSKGRVREARPLFCRGVEADLPTRRGSQQLPPVLGGDGHEPLHLRLVGRLARRWWNIERACRRPPLPDAALQPRGREQEQQPSRPRVHREGVGYVLGPEEERAGARLYRPIAHVEGHLPLEDVEAFVLKVMDVEHTVTLRNEYLYQRVPSVGLLRGGLDGGQPSKPPPRLSFPRIQREDATLALFRCSVGHDSLPRSVLTRRHCAFPFPSVPADHFTMM